jgi:hypothetical protein
MGIVIEDVDLEFVSAPIRKPARIILSGPKGVGKTFLAGHMPRAFIVSTEQGADQTKFPRVEVSDWDGLRIAVRNFHTRRHSFKSLVIDAGNAEAYLQRWVLANENSRLKAQGLSTLDSFGAMNGGWGGHRESLERWQALASYLDTVREDRNANIAFVFHAKDKVQRNPSGADYKCWTLAATDGVGEFLKGWCDASLFLDYETNISGDGKRPGKMTTTGKRELTCLRSDGVDHAKNRYGLPETIDGTAHSLFSRIARFLPEGLAIAERIEGEKGEVDE